MRSRKKDTSIYQGTQGKYVKKDTPLMISSKWLRTYFLKDTED